jgi:carbon monoxide dehydrogenase subunit G
MTQIESKKVIVPASDEKVFAFLSDMNNIEKLLPEGRITEWKSSENHCSFKIQNAYTIGLNFGSSEPHKKILYTSAQGSPFPFTLDVHITSQGSGCETYLLCNADINPFLKMIVVGPLKNLFDYMAERLAQQFPAA